MRWGALELNRRAAERRAGSPRLHSYAEHVNECVCFYMTPETPVFSAGRVVLVSRPSSVFPSFCLCSLSLSLHSPFPSPFTMHSITVQPPLIYSLAEVLLITVHASVLLSSGAATAQEPGVLYEHERRHTAVSQTLLVSSLLPFHVDSRDQARFLLYVLLISADVLELVGILIGSALPRDVSPHRRFLRRCFGTDC